MQELNKVITVFLLLVVVAGILWFLLNRASSVRSFFSKVLPNSAITLTPTPTKKVTSALLTNTTDTFGSTQQTNIVVPTVVVSESKGGVYVTPTMPIQRTITATTYPATGAPLALLPLAGLASFIGLRLAKRNS